jgi:SHS2 domain-containing protein
MGHILICMRRKTPEKVKTAEYEFLEHTADAKFTAYGENFEEALRNACKATTSVMTDVSKLNLKKQQEITIKSKSKESLVYDLLEKLIFLADTEGFLLAQVKKMKIEKVEDNYLLTATLLGDDAESYDVHTQIKAATYNDMKIIETENSCTITAVLDI